MNVYTPDLFDPTGCLISEKYDGICAEWNTKQLLSKDGNVFHAPAWYLDALPPFPVKGDLWVGRGQFETTWSIVSRHKAGLDWQYVRLMAWESDRSDALGPYAAHVQRWPCLCPEYLQEDYNRLIAEGAEGLVIRDRDGIDWKWKPITDDDAIVIQHKPGTGRNAHRCGSLRVRDREGRVFGVGGLNDDRRDTPPAIGSLIKFQFQGRTAKGIPRFAQYLDPRYETDFT
jgi:DNA ligase 1